MRSYEPIWKQLKQDSVVHVVAPPSRHKRIIKAVSKEKWLDTEFRDTGWTRIVATIETDKITFVLKEYRPINVILAEQVEQKRFNLYERR